MDPCPIGWTASGAGPLVAVAIWSRTPHLPLFWGYQPGLWKSFLGVSTGAVEIIQSMGEAPLHASDHDHRLDSGGECRPFTPRAVVQITINTAGQSLTARPPSAQRPHRHPPPTRQHTR